MADDLAGQLAERIMLEIWQPARDEFGDDAGAWAMLGSSYAGVMPDSAGPIRAGEAQRSVRRWRVVLRPRAELAGAAALLIRLRWRGQILRVLGVEDDPRRPDRLVLRCEGQPA